MRAMIAALGAICVLITLTACSSANPATSSPAARTAASATAPPALLGTAAGTASVKPRAGLIAFMRPGTVGEYDIVIVPFAFYLFRPLGTEAAIKRFENWITSHERQIAAAVALLAGGYMVISGLVRVI